MQKQLYLTQAPYSQTPDTTQVKQKPNLKPIIQSIDRRNFITKKNLSNFPLQPYYDDKKIKPGINLFKIIAQTQQLRKESNYEGPTLKLNLPPICTFSDNSNTIIYCQNGEVKTINYATYEQFLQILNVDQFKLHQGLLNLEPYVMSKCCNGIIFDSSIIMQNQISSKILPRSQNVMSMKFIPPFARSPNIIRLFYTAKHVKTLKKNVAYKIINKKQIDDDLFKKKHRLFNNFIVNIENEDSYVANLLKGKALTPCQQMADSLLQYLQKALLIKISQMVLDFIVDQQKNIWFNQIKAVKSKTLTKIWEVGSPEQIQRIARQNNNQIMCRLCGMLYTRQQMQKLVTNKLIYQLVMHLQNRGKKLLNIPHIKNQGLSNVCHLCYQLIKAQHTLINVEQEFAMLMNLDQNSIQRVKSKETKKQQVFFYNEEQFQALGQQTSKYKKWRLFFYIQNIKRIPFLEFQQKNIEINLEMKFQNKKQKFYKKIPNQNYQGRQLKQSNKSYRSSIQKSEMTKTPLRVQSAINFKKNKNEQIGNQQSNIQFYRSGDKNKSRIDESTCVTHSQSYFLNNVTQANITNDNLFESKQCFKQNKNNQKFLKQIEQQSKIDKKEQNRIETLKNINIQKVKMYVFYTKSHQNEGKNIFYDSQLQFNLTIQKHKFNGITTTLQSLKNKDSCQRHCSEIYLFDQGLKYCNLQLTVGLTCDGLVDDQGLDFQKINNLYWGKTYSCDPLPDQWMQVFTNGQEVPKINPQNSTTILNLLNGQNSRQSAINQLKKQKSESILFKNNYNFNNKVILNNLSRPMTGNNSCSNLKKMGWNRCKTALQRRILNQKKQNILDKSQVEDTQIIQFDI